MKLLEEDRELNLRDFESSDGLLDLTPKAQAITEKRNWTS